MAEAGVLAHFDEVDWSDPEQLLDTGGVGLRGLAQSPDLLLQVIDTLTEDDFNPSLGAGGAYWFLVARAAEDDFSVWLRFCPTGCVAANHTHRFEILAMVVAGSFKQTLSGIGGGVDSSDHDIDLYVRHERRGQIFALNEQQQHESSSTAGSLMLAVMPAAAAEGRGERPADGDEKVQKALRRLRRDGATLVGDGIGR